MKNVALNLLLTLAVVVFVNCSLIILNHLADAAWALCDLFGETARMIEGKDAYLGYPVKVLLVVMGILYASAYTIVFTIVLITDSSPSNSKQ